MQIRGIAYDTGFVRHGENAHPRLTPDLARRELAIIRDDLHCNAVHIVGGDADRLEMAAKIAGELGLEVWFSPYPIELGEADMLTLLLDCADRAERLRTSGVAVTFVAGVELTLMNPGFLPGDTLEVRLQRLLEDPALLPGKVLDASARLNEFLSTAVPRIRDRFAGPVTYAAIPFERVDWDLFDVLSVELIRSADVADRFRDGVVEFVNSGKPVAITGFGCATWEGAPEVAPRSMEVLEYDETGMPVAINGTYARDEAGQARYFDELLEIFETTGVHAAFPYLFALYSLPHRPDGPPALDLDLASLGVVKVFEDRNGTAYPDMPWEPKVAFDAIARRYRSHSKDLDAEDLVVDDRTKNGR